MPSSIQLPKLVLASQSPRRRQILETLGLKFRCEDPKDVIEIQPSSSEVVKVTQVNARVKAQAVGVKQPSEVVVGADTLVVLAGSVLGKPKDRAEAAEMLRRLSGQTHIVVTGIALLTSEATRMAAVTSQVTFKSIPDSDLEAYLTTREPYDKAGSYGVQGLGALFIQKIEGSYTNVMGLPIEKFIEELAAITHTTVYDWF